MVLFKCIFVLRVTEEVISGVFLLTILWRFMVAKFKYKGIILYVRLKRICVCMCRVVEKKKQSISKWRKKDSRVLIVRE